MTVVVDFCQYVAGHGACEPVFNIEVGAAEQGAVVVRIETQFATRAFEPGRVTGRRDEAEVETPVKVALRGRVAGQRRHAAQRQKNHRSGDPETCRSPVRHGNPCVGKLMSNRTILI